MPDQPKCGKRSWAAPFRQLIEAGLRERTCDFLRLLEVELAKVLDCLPYARRAKRLTDALRETIGPSGA
jgi:hypothetical protein